MNTHQLESVVRRHGKRFDGVFSSDRLPSQPRLDYSSAIPIHRTCPANIGLQSTWMMAGAMENTLIRSDVDLLMHLDEHCREWTFNCKQLQSITSRFCGYYCAFFCILRSRGVDMRRFLRYFTRDTGLNDVVVHELICSLMQ